MGRTIISPTSTSAGCSIREHDGAGDRLGQRELVSGAFELEELPFVGMAFEFDGETIFNDQA